VQDKEQAALYALARSSTDVNAMPRYKVLKSVAHDIGHSFTSRMNYATDDYTMSHLLRLARKTGKDALTIDFTSGCGLPSELLKGPLSELPRRYTDRFWKLVNSSGSDKSLVEAASLTLKYDLNRSRPGPRGILMTPYACDVSIVDTRGKNYTAHFQDWWYVELRLWWNPKTWFRGGHSV